MMFGVSDEQQELRASVKRFVADRSPLPRVRELMESGALDRDVWDQAGAQLGLQGIAIPEEYGGSGFTFAEQAIVLEELGAGLYGGPYLASAVLAATALLASPDEAGPAAAAARHRVGRDDRDAGLHRGRRVLGHRQHPAGRGQERRRLGPGRPQE